MELVVGAKVPESLSTEQKAEGKAEAAELMDRLFENVEIY